MDQVCVHSGWQWLCYVEGDVIISVYTDISRV